MDRMECCSVQFDTEEALARHHVQAHSQERKAVGTCCQVDFYTEEGLREHQRTSHGR